MTRRAENQCFASERCHMSPPRRHSSPTSPPDVLQLAHMMHFGTLCRAAGFAHTRSHSALQLRIVDVRRRRSIIEDCLILSLQRQATELDLDGPFSLAFAAYLQTDAAMRISSNMLPQRATSFSDGPLRNHRSWHTPQPRRAVLALLKTRNRLLRNAEAAWTLAGIAATG
jgi:hypothetical protein